MDKVVFIPSYNPPIKKENLAPALDRFRMVESAIKSNSRFIVSDIEARREGISYTAHTLLELKSDMPDSELYFIMGMDTFLDIPNWYMPDIIMEQTIPVVLIRPPYLLQSIFDSPYIDRDRVEMDRVDSDNPLNLDFTGDRTARITRITRITRINITLKNGKNLILLKTPPLDISSTMIRNLIARGRSIKYLLPQCVESYIFSNGCGYIKDEQGNDKKGNDEQGNDLFVGSDL